MTQAVATTNGASLTGIEPIEKLIRKEDIKGRFSEVLGQKAAAFMSSILAATNTNTQLKACDPMTVLSSAMIAATLDLPINQSLGFAHLVPYSGRCQFQIGWKGLVQLALRTGQYKKITVTEIFDGELIQYNRITEEAEFNPEGKKDETVIGYYARFVLINGFEKSLYMTRAEVEAHGRKFSKSYETGQWKKDFKSMALKTLVKMLLGKWGILSTDLRRAIVADQAVSNTITIEPENAILEHPDNASEEKTPEKAESVGKTALDIKIHTLKADLKKALPKKDGKHTAGEVFYYAELGNFGVEHMNELSNLNKEVFRKILEEKLQSLKSEAR